MKNILNTIAWLVSISFGFISSGILLSNLYIGNTLYLFFGVIAGLIIKSIFLSEKSIDEAIESMEKNILEESDNRMSSILNTSKNIHQVSLKNQQIETNEKQLDLGKKTKEQTVQLPEVISKKETINNTEQKTISLAENKIKEEKIEILKFVEDDSITTDKTLSKDQHKNSIFTNFFKTNILAKLGAIIVFIGVVFLVSLAWMYLNDFARWILGFIIAGIFYIAGLSIYKKGYKGEGVILFGTAILINFLVILAGRHELSIYPTEQIAILGTFMLLIGNAIFGVVTAIKYKSDTLLLFAFIFAFINPLLLGSEQYPYTFAAYTFFVSVAAMFVGEKYNNSPLTLVAFILGNFLLLIAPHSTELGFLVKFIFTALLAFLFINSKNIHNYTKENSKLLSYGIIFSPILLQVLLKQVEITEIGYLIVFMTALICFGYFIWKSKQKESIELIPLGTIFTMLLLFGINSGESIHTFTILGLCIVAVVNLLLPFCNKQLKNEEHLQFFGSSVISSSIILGIAGLNYLDEGGVPIITDISQIGIIYSIFGAIILGIGSFVTNIFSIGNYKESNKKNVFLLYFGLFISFLTIGISFIFSGYSDFILPTIWIIEATLLYFLYSLTKDEKFITFGNILGIIAYIGFFIVIGNYSDTSQKTNEIHYITILLGSILTSLYFLKEKIINYNLWHHLAGIFLVYIGFTILSEGPATQIFIIITTLILGFYYLFLEITPLRKVFLWILGATMIYEVGAYIENKNTFITTLNAIALSSFVFFNYKKKPDDTSIKGNILFAIFLFIIVSLILIYTTDSIYSATIFWGIVGCIFINIGIQKKQVVFRTIGLYLISIIALKIFFVDIWAIGNPIIATIIFIILGIVLIGTSLLYTKYIGNDISSEFSWENIYKQKNIYQKIQQTNIETIDSVIFYNNEKELFRSKKEPILKIAAYVSKLLGKQEFKENELLPIFTEIKENFPSKISPQTRKQVEEVFKKFATTGGNVEFINK